MTSDEIPNSLPPAPAAIDVIVEGQSQRLTFEQAFVAGCTLVEKGRVEAASKLFNRLEQFDDRGPRAFVMHAFCECAAKEFDRSKSLLDMAFGPEHRDVAAELHDAFVSYHVGIRREGLKSLAHLVDAHENLPTLCLLLGNMLQESGNVGLAQRCWSLAVKRDRAGGAVAAVAKRQLQKHSAADDGDGAAAAT